MFLLIFNEQRVPKITFVLVLTYYVKLHLFVILTAIGKIQRVQQIYVQQNENKFQKVWYLHFLHYENE
jgi:hypothetical protein